MHPRFKTPTVSTLFIGGVAIVIYVLLSLLGENAYGDVLLAIGLQISFYYGILPSRASGTSARTSPKVAETCGSRGSCRCWAD